MPWWINKTMIEKIPNQNQEKENRFRVQSEQEYITLCVEYALSTGWVKEAQQDVLVEKYLKPIHKKYCEIVEELKNEKEVSEEDLRVVVRWLNYSMESTRRIGSTDKDNVIKAIEDYRDRAPYPYTHYAVESLLEFIKEALQS